MKKYILFDNDGVLVNTEFWYFKANQRALSEVGVSLELEQYFHEIMAKGLSSFDWAKPVGIDDATIDVQREKRDLYYQEYLKTEDIEIGGVEDVLKDLSKDYRMAVITTAKGKDFHLIHGSRNLLLYMEFALVREDYVNAKPLPDPYLKGLEKLGGKKEEAIIVEDSERGLMSAVAAEIDCAVVYNEFTQAHDFSKATYKIQSLSELRQLL